MYDIGIAKGLRVSPEFGTMFQYSQNHIESYLIPNLEMLRNNFLINQSDIYECIICDQDDPDFGSTNTDGELTEDGWINGDSYNTHYDNVPIGIGLDLMPIYPVDSVEFYNIQIQGWKDQLEMNEMQKVTSLLDQNISFDAGTIYENSVTTEESTEITDAFTFMVSPSVGAEVGVEIMSVGTTWSMERTYTFETTNEYGQTETKAQTYGYVLADGNGADYLSVDVKKAILAPTGPIFITRGGQTMCPYEEGEVTEYYQPGTQLNESTMQREIPKINCETPIQTNVPADAKAIFNVQLANISETGDDQWMILSVDDAANTGGALIGMDGSSIGGGRMILLPAGETISKVITVSMVQPDVYDYENLTLILHSACQYDPTDFQLDIADSLRISAFFQPVCSGVDLNNPENQWVVNTNSDTTINVGISNYDLGHDSFDKIMMQYKSTSTPNWTTDMTFYVDEDAYNSASEPKTFIDGQANLNHIFMMEDMQDRNYDIKLTTTCVDGTENNSATATGIKDVKRPQLFGSPQPADGILTPSDEVMISFDEAIYAGGLLPYNFSVKGVLNGNELKHESCLFFDGTTDYASVVKGVNLTDKSFTVEFWARRGDLTESVVFSQEDLELGFNSSNKFYLKANNQTILSQSDFTDTDTWYHFAVTYDYETSNFNMFVNDIIEQDAVTSTSAFLANGKMYVGKSNENTNYFNGFIHELRVWETALGFGTVYANMYQSLVGNEIGLGGYWPMSEAQGEIAEDKSRSHHANLYGAEWRVFPTGFARTFDGTANLNINSSSSVILTYQNDFTVEFYFKGQPQTNSVLFSNGKGDGSDITPSYENIWVIGVDANGLMYAKNNGVFITAPDEEFMDDSWHHVALVCNRQANTSLYIDGEMKAYDQSSKFGGLYGPQMTIGARMLFSDIGPETYDNNFTGSMDELRIWNLSRTAKQISLDMNSKLHGDEMGLLAYYPFDKYDDLGTQLIPMLEDATGRTDDLAIAEGGGESNIDVPNIKDARPVQNVNFDWVVNNDQIIININEQPSAVEKCILEFTVERIEDLRENRIASPVTWTAYIKQNTVIWNDFEINFTKEVYAELEFDLQIQNAGGTEEGYTISGLPSWLTVDEPTGTLAPDSYKTLHFTVNPVVNIGDYDVSLFLTSDFGYDEKLALNLNVFKPSPEWEVEEGDYQYSMNVIGQIKIDGKFSSNENDKVAAFVMEDGVEVCRAVSNSQYIPEFDMFEVFVTIYSNQESGEDVYFKIWNASEGYEHVNVTPNLTFMYNQVIGTPNEPQIIESFNSYNFSNVLQKGWTWMSFNLENEHFSNVNTIMANVPASTNDQIKTQASFANYHEQFLWDGSLKAEGFNNTSLYMFKMQESATLTYWGSKLRVAETEIPVNTGWNWISYIPRTNMTVNDAFGNYHPANNDIVKSQYAFAMYNTSLGWIGDLQYMVPGQGYMYQTTNTEGIMTYPENGLNRTVPQEGLGHNPISVKGWDYSPENYEFSTSVVAKLLINNVTTEHIIGAFIGEECVGISQAKKLGADNEMMYFMTIHANTPGKVTFKMIDTSTGTISDINEEINFAPNQVIGDFNTPLPLTINTKDNQDENFTVAEYFMSEYPNPFSSELNISYGLPEQSDVLIEVYDILGKKVLTIEENTMPAGIHSVKWNGLNNSGKVASNGVYLVRISVGNFVRTTNVIKQ